VLNDNLTIGAYLEDLARRFAAAELSYGHGTDNPRDEASYLVFCTLGLDFDGDPAQLERPLTASELALLEQRARTRIIDHVPVAYLVGQAWFAGQRFRVDERALIPRSPIGELIEHRFEPLLQEPPRRILDLCTGSGCIGIACALVFPAARVDLADISKPALALAAENIALHGLGGRVHTITSDLFDALPDRYDLIVSNPPYVAAADVAALPAEYRHEPVLGLVSAREGLEIPLRILASAADHLSPQGTLVMEVGLSDEALQRLLPDVPFLWLDFERGGEGVLAMDRATLLKYRHRFI
jgi:ribosomal protein L3 glutamine methyltransferase